MSEAHPSADTRSELQRWLGSYSEDHRHPANIAIHWVCVPLILWTVIAALWTVPVPPWLGRPGLWAGAGMFVALMFYLRLSRTLGYAMLGVFVLLGLGSEGLYRALGAMPLLALAGGVFLVAWIAQFIGHHLEGKRPSFLTDLAYLLIGPAWLVAKLLRRLGVAI
ncbi:MAG TPA: DUF962 domain-containing protein [Rhodanobacteraceae bacterium]|nr:DUF962 domain-containing protein [Rhodanobacteraceae bacterium]